MDTLIDLSWRAYPASALMAVGIALVVTGAKKARAGLSSPGGGPANMLAFVKGFRIAVFGVALAGFGVAWQWQLTWVLVLSLVFGGEELLESTTHISILTRPPRPSNKPTRPG